MTLATVADGRIVSLNTGVNAPVWAEHDLAVEHRDGAFVIGTAGDTEALARWAGAAEVALQRTRDAALGPAGDGWDGRAIVVLPTSGREYAAITGQLPESMPGDSGAYASCQVESDTACLVVVNPGVVDEAGASEAEDVLTHEFVHVATSFAAAPSFLAEGLAQSVEYVGERDRLDWLRDARLAALAVTDAGELPDEYTFYDDDVSDANYAFGWVVFEALVRHHGWDQVMAWYAEGRPADADLLALVKERTPRS